MSLRVWLPLNGDLRNNGLNNIAITDKNITIDNNGKLGKCYSFNGSNSSIMATPAPFTNSSSEWSFCCWLKLRSTQYGCLFSDRTASSNTDIAVFYYGSQWIVDDGVRWLFTPTNALSTGVWYHVAVVVKKGVGKYLYINGELDSSTTATGTPTIVNPNWFSIGASMNSATTVNANYFNGYLNDVRIYDHALSVNEVKEISKGLVAHYKLDNEDKVVDSSGYGNHGSKLGTLTYSEDTARNSISTNFNGVDNGILIENLPLSNIINTEVTYSFWLKPNGENGARSVYFGSYNGTSWSIEKTTGNVLRSYWNGSPDESCSGATITDGVWQHIVITKKGTNEIKVYINGVLKWTSTATHSDKNFPTTYRIGRDIRSGDGTPYKGLMSDFRIYATALSADDIKELYQVGAKIDNKSNISSYELVEDTTNRELLSRNYSIYGSTTNTYSTINENGELYFNKNGGCATDYIPINSSGKTYYYDYTVSVAAGNQFYIGFERYDANKTPRSNHACTYIFGTKPSTDIVKKRYRGTVNLSTDGVNPCAFIRLRVLNAWSGTDSSSTKLATIHQISLREVSNLDKTQICKTGQLKTDMLREFFEGNASIEKTGAVNTFEYKEI